MNGDTYGLGRLADRMKVDLAAFRESAAEVRGVGVALDGLVRVTCRPGGAIDEVFVDPRAMRCQSAALAEAFEVAHAEATADAAAALTEVASGAGDLSDVAAQVHSGQIDMMALLERRGVPVRDLIQRLTSG